MARTTMVTSGFVITTVALLGGVACSSGGSSGGNGSGSDAGTSSATTGTGGGASTSGASSGASSSGATSSGTASSSSSSGGSSSGTITTTSLTVTDLGADAGVRFQPITLTTIDCSNETNASDPTGGTIAFALPASFGPAVGLGTGTFAVNLGQGPANNVLIVEGVGSIQYQGTGTFTYGKSGTLPLTTLTGPSGGFGGSGSITVQGTWACP